MTSTKSLSSEKKGQISAAARTMEPFVNMIRRCDLLNMGFSDPKYTWSNMRSRLENVQERLDMAMCNQEWLRAFPSHRVLHLPRSRSDHHPVLIQPRRATDIPHCKAPFRLQATWFLHSKFEEFLHKCWTEDRVDDLGENWNV